MNNSESTYLLPKLLSWVWNLFAVLVIIAVALPSYGDIYRFVTIDGVETFTDTPNNRDAKLIIKDASKKRVSTRGKSLPRKAHDISLNEIAEKTVLSSSGNQAPKDNSNIEPHLPPVGGTITSGVGMRIDPIDGKWRQHNGIDISIPEGTPVKPATSGIVAYTGLRTGYGNTILLEHDNNMITLYAHNSRIMASPGQFVDTNTVIAYSGNTGRSTGPHLHFEAWQSGVNITSAFMPGSTFKIQKGLLATHKPRDRFRRVILDDGSVLFTNIPASIP